MRYLIVGVTGGLNRAWQRYLYYLDHRPGFTQSCNTSLMMAGGDFIAQLFAENRSLFRDYDFRRTARFAILGLAIAGPTMTVWYRALDQSIKGSKGSMALRKTFLDQAFFLPVYLVGFVSIMGLLRRDQMPEIAKKVKRDFRPMLMTSYSIWPAVQMLNFYVLPLKHRILAINIVCLFWNAYVAWKAEQEL